MTYSEVVVAIKKHALIEKFNLTASGPMDFDEALRVGLNAGEFENELPELQSEYES